MAKPCSRGRRRWNTLARRSAKRRNCRGMSPGLSVWPPRITRHAFYSALLKGLTDHYPELRVEVLSGVQPVNLHRRDADLAIRMVKPEAGHLTLKRLGTVGFGVYGAADCLVGADGLSLSEADFVGWPETHQHLPAAQWITRTLRGRPCKVEANTLVAQVSAISAGLGLGVLPHFMARASGLQCLQPEIGADQTLWLVMHSDRRIQTRAGSRRPSHRSLCGPSRSAGDALKGRGLGVYR